MKGVKLERENFEDIQKGERKRGVMRRGDTMESGGKFKWRNWKNCDLLKQAGTRKNDVVSPFYLTNDMQNPEGRSDFSMPHTTLSKAVEEGK